MAGRFALAIRLRFHNHAPQQLPSGLALHQQAAYELGGNLLGGAGEEALGVGGVVLGGRGGYGSGLGGRRWSHPATTPITDLKTLLPQHFEAK